MYSDFYAAANPAAVIGLLDEIDRLRNEAVAADIRIANDALVIAGLTAERDALARCKLADQDAYVAMRDQRDAIAKDNDKAHALLRQSLDALEAALSDDQPYIQQSKDAVTAIKEFL